MINVVVFPSLVLSLPLSAVTIAAGISCHEGRVCLLRTLISMCGVSAVLTDFAAGALARVRSEWGSTQST